jgi:hypothetical protein
MIRVLFGEGKLVKRHFRVKPFSRLFSRTSTPFLARSYTPCTVTVSPSGSVCDRLRR